jgi:hypothetical protein
MHMHSKLLSPSREGGEWDEQLVYSTENTFFWLPYLQNCFIFHETIGDEPEGSIHFHHLHHFWDDFC